MSYYSVQRITVKDLKENIPTESTDIAEIEKTKVEDGKTIRIFQDNTEEGLINISQGEAWRVNLEYKEEEYKELLSEGYQGIDMTEFMEMSIDGNDAIKIEFNYEVGDKIFNGLKYLVIVGYSGFDFTCEYLEGSLYKKNFESIIS